MAIRWSPWNISQWLDEDFELPAQLSRLGFGQGVNLYETDNNVVAELAVPGVSEDRIDVTVENNVVRISGRREETQDEREGRRYFMSSLNNSYSYVFRLPESVASDQEPQAELEDGVLMLNFPKIERQPPKRVEIKHRQNKEGKRAV